MKASTKRRRRVVAPRAISPARWNRMTNAQKTVAIAKDAIYRVRIGQMVPDTGNWVAVMGATHSRSLQTAMKDKVACECCALGGALCGLAFHENNLSISVAGDGPTERLLDVMGEENAKLIEIAFEVGLGSYSLDEIDDYKMADRAEEFGRRYSTPRGRFLAIFRNVVKHKGVFTP